MPWNDQSKNGQPPPSGGGGGPSGPWGSGPRQPWGTPPRGPKGPQGPDLEDLMRQWRERFNLGGRGSDALRGGPRGFALGAAIVGVIWLASGVYVVNTGQQAVVTRFGALVRVVDPGPHWHVPFPVEQVRVESLTDQRRIKVGDLEDEGLMLAGDKSIIETTFTVLWRVQNITDYTFNVREPESVIKAVAESAMREIVGNSQVDEIMTTERGRVEVATAELMQRTLDSYKTGVFIVSIQINTASPPQDVVDAFQDVIKAGQDQTTKKNDAMAYANDVVPKARGAAAALIQGAEAYKQQTVAEAQGDAQRFTSVLTEYRKNPRVTRERLYLETMERVIGGADKVIIDKGAGAVPILPLDQLRSAATPGGAR